METAEKTLRPCRAAYRLPKHKQSAKRFGTISYALKRVQSKGKGP